MESNRARKITMSVYSSLLVGHPLSILSNALTRVAHFVVYLTPIGVFAIAASAAGTMTMEEFGRLQAYMITFIVAAALLTFWILPVLASTFTPFKYKDLVSFSKDALVTALTNGVDQLDFLTGRQKKSNREGFPVYNGDEIFAYKWRNWKMH